MAKVSADFEAIATAGSRLGDACFSFSQGRGTVGGLPGAAAPDANASALLDRVIDAAADVLRAMASELDGFSSGLGRTAASYRSAEDILSNWQLPGGQTL